jgi:60 kDa SS-A/Ro ribonucleoprotein
MIGGLDALQKRDLKRRITTGKSKATIEREVSYPARKRYLPEIITAFEQAKTADEATLVKLITEHDLPREAIPTDKLNSLAVWEALLEKMPMTALVRNLGKMTSIGLLKPLSAAAKKVTTKLKDTEQLQKSRIHPMAILIALKVYENGHGVKGDLTWKPVPAIVQALDEAFYLAFGNVRKTGKPLLFGLDVSGSMSAPISGSVISCCEASTALALIHANVEDEYHIMRFNNGIQDTPIRKGMRLAEALKYTNSINGGGTDCSLPAQWALKNKVEIGGIIIQTDNETWAGAVHPFQALKKYRDAHVADCRQVVVGMATSGFSIADPTDKLSMDVVGFDASAPNVIADFIRGELT